LKVAVQGPDFMAYPLYIHTYTHKEMKTHQFQTIRGTMHIKERNRVTIVQGDSLGGRPELITLNY
jgi:hypothetical protein